MEQNFPYIEISGTEYESGVQIGRLFGSILCEETKAVEHFLKDPAVRKDLETVRTRLESEYPDALLHAYGRADGAGADREAYLLYLCYELWEGRETERCSDIIAAQGGRVLMGHNEDGGYSVGNSALLKCVTGNGWYFDFATPDALAGGSFGFTSRGLLFTMNYMYVETMRSDRIPVWFFLRSLVDCGSIEEIKDKLSRMDIASGFHWNLFIGGKAYEIEAKYDRAELSEVQGIFIHTNHYVNPSLDEGYSDPEANTLFRYAKIKELIRKDHILRTADVESAQIPEHHVYNSIFETPEMGRGIRPAPFCTTAPRTASVHEPHAGPLPTFPFGKCAHDRSGRAAVWRMTSKRCIR